MTEDVVWSTAHRKPDHLINAFGIIQLSISIEMIANSQIEMWSVINGVSEQSLDFISIIKFNRHRIQKARIVLNQLCGLF